MHPDLWARHIEIFVILLTIAVLQKRSVIPYETQRNFYCMEAWLDLFLFLYEAISVFSCFGSLPHSSLSQHEWHLIPLVYRQWCAWGYYLHPILSLWLPMWRHLVVSDASCRAQGRKSRCSALETKTAQSLNLKSTQTLKANKTLLVAEALLSSMTDPTEHQHDSTVCKDLSSWSVAWVTFTSNQVCSPSEEHWPGWLFQVTMSGMFMQFRVPLKRCAPSAGSITLVLIFLICASCSCSSSFLIRKGS